MCRLFGMHAGPNPVRAIFWLLQATDSLVSQSLRNPDGAGIGVFAANGTPVVEKQPLAAWQDSAFLTAARELRSTTFLAHVRYATTGSLSVANTHPFQQDGRLFAHNGVVRGLEALEARLDLLDGMHLARGQTDSERIFALITAETRRNGGDLRTGLVDAIGWIGENLPTYSCNFVLTTPDSLWALRYPATHELHVLARPAGGSAAGPGALDARTSRIGAASDHLATKASVIIATEPMDTDPGWKLLQPGELLHVDPGLTVRTMIAFPDEPRHLLSRADLDAAAKSSQHP